MKIHQLIDRLQEFDPDADVIVVFEDSKEGLIDDVQLADTGEVCIEAVEDGD